jgi:hypothetical protein
MATPFLLAETPRGGPFGHRFIIPPAPDLRSTEVEAYFQRAALGPGSNFIAVNRQVMQHLPTGAAREGAETLLMAGLEVKKLSKAQTKQIRQLLTRRLPDLEQLVTEKINWEEAGPQTLVIRAELADWLRQDLAGKLARLASTPMDPTSPISPWAPKDERSAILIGSLLALAVGALTLFLWFF